MGDNMLPFWIWISRLVMGCLYTSCMTREMSFHSLWYVTAPIRHTYHKEWKLISLVIQLVYKHPITNLDIQIQEGSMLSMMFTFQLQITWIDLLIGITKFSIIIYT